MGTPDASRGDPPSRWPVRQLSVALHASPGLRGCCGCHCRQGHRPVKVCCCKTTISPLNVASFCATTLDSLHQPGWRLISPARGDDASKCARPAALVTSVWLMTCPHPERSVCVDRTGRCAPACAGVATPAIYSIGCCLRPRFCCHARGGQCTPFVVCAAGANLDDSAVMRP
jgi:hypothetical protein